MPVCWTCGETKEEKLFKKHSKSIGGYDNHCLECTKKKNKQLKEKAKGKEKQLIKDALVLLKNKIEQQENKEFSKFAFIYNELGELENDLYFVPKSAMPGEKFISIINVDTNQKRKIHVSRLVKYKEDEFEDDDEIEEGEE